MNKKLGALSLALAGAFIFASAAQAAPLTLTGNFLKVGISDYGTFGSNGSVSPGLLHDPTGTANFGVNDYLTPGTPHDGYGIKSLETGFIENDNRGISSFGTGSPTALAGPAALGYVNTAAWTGSTSLASITNSYFFNPNDQRILVKTLITATRGLTALKFVRSEDPDPDVRTFGSYATNNQRGNALFGTSDFIGSAGPSTGLFLGFLNNSGNTYAHNTYIGTGCCSTVDPDTVLAGGSNSNFGDYSLNMAWNIGDLAAGKSAEISYYYVFGDKIDTGGGDPTVPEPGTLYLLGLTLLGLAASRRRKMN